MSEIYTVIQKTRVLGGLLLIGAISAGSGPLRAEADEVTKTRKVSLGEVLSAFEATKKIHALETAIQEKTSASSVLSSQFMSSPVLGFESENGTGNNKEKLYTAKLSTSFNLGASRSLAEHKATLESEADKTKLKKFLADQKLDLALDYIKASYHQATHTNAKKSLLLVQPLMEKADLAASRGIVPKFLLRRWQLMLQNIKATASQSLSDLGIAAATLEAATEMAFAKDVESIIFDKIDTTEIEKLKLSEENSFSWKEASFRKESLNTKAQIEGRKFEISAGVGIVRNDVEKQNAYLFEVGIPLFQPYYNASEARVSRAEAATVEKEADLNFSSEKRLYQKKIATLNQNKSAVSLAEEKLNTLEALYSDVSAAAARGQTDAAELLEVITEVHEARSNYLEKVLAYETSGVELMFFLNGDSK